MRAAEVSKAGSKLLVVVCCGLGGFEAVYEVRHWPEAPTSPCKTEQHVGDSSQSRAEKSPLRTSRDLETVS